MIEDCNDADYQILKLLAADDARASSLLYKIHYKAVYRYVNDYVHNHNDSMDIVQELFIAIWIKRHSLNIMPPIRKYLLRAARNKAINYVRNTRTRKRIMNEAINRAGHGDLAPPADANLAIQELKQQIKRAIIGMPVPARNTFILSRRYGLTYKEIAAHFLVTEKAVEKNMTKALRFMRKFLEAYLKLIIFILFKT